MPIIDRINELLGRLVSWLTLLMVLVMCTSVAQRYVFDATVIWQAELVRYCHGLIFLLAAGYTLKAEKHVRIDIWYNGASEKTQALINIAGTLLFLFPSLAAIAYYSTDFIVGSWALLERSAESGGLEGVYLFKTAIWVFCLTVLLQGMSLIAHSYKRLRNG